MDHPVSANLPLLLSEPGDATPAAGPFGPRGTRQLSVSGCGPHGRFALLTDVGICKGSLDGKSPVNEDDGCVLIDSQGRAVLWVADGVGSSQGAEIASRVVTDVAKALAPLPAGDDVGDGAAVAPLVDEIWNATRRNYYLLKDAYEGLLPAETWLAFDARMTKFDPHKQRFSLLAFAKDPRVPNPEGYRAIDAMHFSECLLNYLFLTTNTLSRLLDFLRDAAACEMEPGSEARLRLESMRATVVSAATTASSVAIGADGLAEIALIGDSPVWVLKSDGRLLRPVPATKSSNGAPYAVSQYLDQKTTYAAIQDGDVGTLRIRLDAGDTVIVTSDGAEIPELAAILSPSRGAEENLAALKAHLDELHRVFLSYYFPNWADGNYGKAYIPNGPFQGNYVYHNRVAYHVENPAGKILATIPVDNRTIAAFKYEP